MCFDPIYQICPWRFEVKPSDFCRPLSSFQGGVAWLSGGFRYSWVPWPLDSTP